MRKIKEIVIGIIIIAALAAVVYAVGAAAWTDTGDNQATKHRDNLETMRKITIVATPGISQVGTNTYTSSESYYGTLKRIHLAASGYDSACNIRLKDDSGSLIFVKDAVDCANSLPQDYAIVQSDINSVEYLGCPVAGALTLELIDVDPNTLASVTATLWLESMRNK